MKCTTVIAPERDEEVILYLHKKSRLSEKIEELVLSESIDLVGYVEKSIVKLSPDEIICFAVEQNKTYAITAKQKLWVRQRLYVLEELLGKDFVKINQSCLANIQKIARFDASIGGSLLVIFQNGYRDYISRRQLKTVKERIGLRS